MHTHTRITPADMARAEATSANAEVDAEIADLCRTLEVPLACMQLLPMPVLGAFILIRMFKKLSLKLRELDARVGALEVRSTDVPPAYRKDTVQ